MRVHGSPVPTQDLGVLCAAWDPDCAQHAARVGALSGLIAATLGMPDSFVENISRAAALHDVGKIGVPRQILGKPGPLTAAERAIVQQHTTTGATLLKGRGATAMAIDIALLHHERWDGAGYPLGLGGEDIPLAARIVAVADVFDALTWNRSYRRAWPVRRALEEMVAQRGAQFDSRVVDALVRAVLRTRAAASDLGADPRRNGPSSGNATDDGAAIEQEQAA